MAAKVSKGCVLLVDDDEPIRDSLSELLTMCGFEVLTAESVDAGAASIEKNGKIEAVVCDLKMPGKSGIELLRYLNGKSKKIPVIFLTGYGTLETCQEAVREGAFDYILKPITEKDKILFPLMHAVAQTRLERRNKQLQEDILRMAEEHQALVDGLLNDAETKASVQKKISDIVDKWKR